ncbi:hypothetical protein [Aureimonas ureilytica]|uniref:hypothetical protein n=1 Tax=Aureimonas ureilytica TaxID=401562 RepID=UPI000374ABE7|nr:hypothetical protein [Aureimonas ureilytica]
MERFTIYATVAMDGTKAVQIDQGDTRKARRIEGDRAHAQKRIDDYQTAVCDTLQDVRSCLVANFGIGFLSIARKRIAQLQKAAAA